VKVPLAEHSVNIPPSFGQLSFFAVRPGESYHDVEEVYHGKEGKRIRMAISGWYHIPQEGEDGYEEGAEESQAQKSSLAQLKGAADDFDEPAARFKEMRPISSADEDILTEEELTFLLDYITPSYLTPEMTEKLAVSFIEDSVIQLEGVLRPALANELKHYVQNLIDTKHWPIARPPHKHRFQYQRPTENHTCPIQRLLSVLLQSPAFRKWLGLVTSLVPKALTLQNVLARRFRKGQDYALASAYAGEEPRLEYTLGLTPNKDDVPMREPNGKTNGTNGTNGTHTDTNGINVDVSGEDDHGGQEVYMAGDDEEDTPSNALPQVGKKAAHDPAVYKAGDEEDDDAILFTDSPSWNTLSIVMRDQGTLRFVKYVSQAGRDRWDIKGEIEIDHELDERNEDNENDDGRQSLLEDDEDETDEDSASDEGSSDSFSSNEEEEEQDGA